MFLKLFVRCMHVRKNSSELFVCSSWYLLHKIIRKDVIRGALTDGQEWIFIILKMKPDGNGGTYAQSEELYIMARTFNRKEINRVTCSVISGIIAYWASDLPLPLTLLTSNH